MRSTSVSVSALRYSSIQSDTLAQEQHLSGGNEAVWVVRQPFCFTDKNYKISVLEICSFFSSHIIISPISLQTVLSDLLSFLWTSCPWQVASPQKPGSRAYLQRTFLISTASLPSPTPCQWSQPWLPASTLLPTSTFYLLPPPKEGIILHTSFCKFTCSQSLKPSPEAHSFWKLSTLWAAELIQLNTEVCPLLTPLAALPFSCTQYWEIWFDYTQLICLYSNFHNRTLKWEFDPEFIEIQST